MDGDAQVFYYEEIPVDDDEQPAPKDELTYVATACQTRGDMPAKRGGATLTLVETKGRQYLYMIGGANRDGEMFNDVHRYNLASGEWNHMLIENSDSFEPRSGHTAVAVGSLIYVFGGLNLPQQTTYNSVHVLDTDAMKWSTPPVLNDPPRPRNAHTALRTSKGIIVFGGSSPSEGAMNDVHLLTIHDAILTWQAVACHGPPLHSRELHAATLLDAKAEAMYVSGGRLADGQLCSESAVLDLGGYFWPASRHSMAVIDSWTWRVEETGSWRRCGHVVGRINGALVHYGGWDGGNGFCDDGWVRQENAEENKLVPLRVERPASGDCVLLGDEASAVHDTGRLGHTACVVGPTLYVFGGMTVVADLNDLWTLASRS
ncbi:hypothetical protein ACHHYP_03206 [Achlya hypogyna]|uniref:Uncharacterized protein n=1 Tax=Achlya hypogyna TaxID=1202772 RepID=A0A1V9Z470_ACHHY|nr:hypothetical protein ACHHYP_03206 [Achlya hypogyna]